MLMRNKVIVELDFFDTGRPGSSQRKCYAQLSAPGIKSDCVIDLFMGDSWEEAKQRFPNTKALMQAFIDRKVFNDLLLVYFGRLVITGGDSLYPPQQLTDLTKYLVCKDPVYARETYVGQESLDAFPWSSD